MVEIDKIPINISADADADDDIGVRAALAADRRLAFCLAGRAIFTLQNVLTGNRFTYRIRARRRHGYFVGVLRGADNLSDYAQIGTIETY